MLYLQKKKFYNLLQIILLNKLYRNNNKIQFFTLNDYKILQNNKNFKAIKLKIAIQKIDNLKKILFYYKLNFNIKNKNNNIYTFYL